MAALLNPGLIAVVRDASPAQIIPLSEALIKGGITAIEITTTTPDAIKAIAEASKHFGKRALIGVGTVLDADTCIAALDAGAEFVVTPVYRPAFVKLVHDRDRPIMLGAFTPTEAQDAFEAGADFIKIFPIECVGPEFIRSLHGPLPHLKIIPTGGVDLGNMGELFKAGACAVGLAGSLITREILRTSNWAELTSNTRAFIAAAAAARVHP